MSVHPLEPTVHGSVGIRPWDVGGLVATLANWAARPRVNVALVLGTSNSWIVRRGQRRGSSPSCLVPLGQPAWAGVKPQQLDGREPAGVVLSRPFYAGRVQHRQHAISLVKRWLRSESPWGAHAVVAVPHDLTPAERRTVEQVVLTAGAQQVYLVDESLVAGLGAGLAVLEPRAAITMDLGASSTRISVMALGKVTRSRILPVGGEALTEAIVDFLVERHGLKVGLPTAQRIKHTIGCASLTDASASMHVDGIRIASGLPVRIEVSAAEICEALLPVLSTMADHLRRTLEEVQPQLLADGTPSVTLVGGGARLTGLGAYLRQHIHVGVNVPGDGVLAAGLDILLTQTETRRALLSPASTATAAALPVARQRPGLFWALGGVSMLLMAHLAGPLAIFPSSLDGALTAGLVPVWTTFHQWTHPVAVGQPINPAQRLLTRQLRESLQQNGSLMQELQTVKADNEHLRSLVHIASQGRHVGAQVMSRDPGAWLSTMTLNVGRRDHVLPGMAVMSDTGLVGSIFDVTPTTARVHTITFQGTTLAGMVAERNASGVLYGINGHTCEMRYLNPNSGVKVGDWVKTSGHDAYPEGYPIGRILEVHPAADGVSWNATVRPAVSLDAVRDVMVMQR